MSPEEIKFWRDRIEAANARGYFDKEDDIDAGRWNTCAVGEQVKLFPKIVLLDCWDGPRDPVLERLGQDFGAVVEDSYSSTLNPYRFDGPPWTPKYEHPILEAYRLLDLIEARVMVLKGRARRAA